MFFVEIAKNANMQADRDGYVESYCGGAAPFSVSKKSYYFVKQD